MNNQPFSIKDAYSFGFHTIFNHFLFFLALMIVIALAASLVFGVIVGITFLPFLTGVMEAAQTVGLEHAIQVFVGNLSNRIGLFLLMIVLSVGILSLFGSFIRLGYTKILLGLYDRNYSSIGMLFSCSHLVLRNFVGMILYGLLCSLGFLFFIIPGIYFLVTYGFYHQVIVDKEVGVFEAFSKSAEITHGAKWKILSVLGSFLALVAGVSLLKNVLSNMAIKFSFFPLVFLSVWILVTIIISLFEGVLFALLNVYMYRKLLSAPRQ
jgi:hypothetical protein